MVAGFNADVAQLVEQLTCNQQVGGSSPFIGSVLFYGWVPEWPKGADCKSVSSAFEGSNPSPSTCDIRLSPFGLSLFLVFYQIVWF